MTLPGQSDTLLGRLTAATDRLVAARRAEEAEYALVRPASEAVQRAIADRAAMLVAALVNPTVVVDGEMVIAAGYDRSSVERLGHDFALWLRLTRPELFP